MRKAITHLFALAIALFAVQGAMAQTSEDILFEEKFDAGMGDFKVEGYNGVNNDIWQWYFFKKAMFCDAYGKITEPVENRLVSPQVALGSGVTVSFTTVASNFPDVATEVAFSVREVGGTWADIQLPVTDNSGVPVTQDIAIPADFDGKNVEFGFKYTSKASSSSGTWLISKFVVKGGKGEPAQKADPELSFNVTEVNYTIGDVLETPVLNNPHAVAVTYSSDNEMVAQVGADGMLTINAEGTATIKAASAETDAYLAGEASYVLNVSPKQGGDVVEGTVFEEAFDAGMGDFKVEGNNGVNNDIWQWYFFKKAMYCDAYGKITEPLENRLVSPEMTLGSNNTVSFLSVATAFPDVAKEIALSVREVGGEWTDIQLPVTENTGVPTTQEIAVPAEFNGKKVQFGFKYTAQSSASSGTWLVSKFIVKAGSGDVPAEKADPEISYSVGDVEAVMGEAFEAPVLNNPNGVEIVYSSKKPEVATVDPATGAVTLVGEGFTTITATSVENDKFKSAAVNYVLTVKPASASGIVFEESFELGFGEFTVEGFNGDESNSIWKAFGGATVADAYGKIDGPVTNYLVSPEFTLSAGGNTASFDYSATFFAEDVISTEMVFSIREAGGEWEDLVMPVCKISNEYISSGDIVIPAAYNGKKVQVAFKYSSKSSNSSGVWSVKNLVVKSSGAAPVEKADPEISYSVGDVEAFMGEAFEAPVLNNPNGVEIVYSSKKPEVATVDPATGAVTLVGEGFTTITATSVENDKFKSAAVNYVLTVKPAPSGDIILEELFETSLGEFTVEGFNGTEAFPIWTNSSGTARADAYFKIEKASTNYLVSPEITLGAEGNVANFIYFFNNYGSATIPEQIGFAVREVGGEWEELVMPVCEQSSEFISSGDIVIPSAYAGKNVQVAFRYYAESSNAAGVWGIDMIQVKKTAAPAEKADPEISFDVTEVSYNLGEEFVAPVLNNPNGVEVVYSSSDAEVAQVDAVTGAVTFVNAGVVTITATSVENDSFKSAAASYTVTVTDVPTGIEGITADDLKNGKVYNLQGVRVDKLGKGVYIVNGKKVVIK